jgi:hypothetical protein
MSRPLKKKSDIPSDDKTLQRIEKIRSQIQSMTYVCSGSLQKRMKVCGKPTCRCAFDPDARHGPYYEWSRLVDGKMVHSVISPQQARILRQAIANFRMIRRLLGKWEQETLRSIDIQIKKKP